MAQFFADALIKTASDYSFLTSYFLLLMPQFIVSHTHCFSSLPATLSPSATVPLTNSSGSDDNGRPLEPSLNPDQR